MRTRILDSSECYFPPKISMFGSGLRVAMAKAEGDPERDESQD